MGREAIGLALLVKLSEKPPMSEPRKTHQRDPSATRLRILSAAQQAFSESGYTHSGIRHIASLAGVNSALIQRYFGSKAGLFEAALSDAVPPIPGKQLAMEELGSRLTAKSLAGFFDLRAQSMIVLSVSDPDARAICVSVLKERAIEPLAKLLGPPHAETRAARVVMLMTGFMLFTRQVQLVTPELAREEGTSEWLSGLVQELVGDQSDR